MYKKELDKIIISDISDFKIKHILDCGQIFRYKIEGDNAVVYSLDKKMQVKTFSDRVEIYSNDLDYAEEFFDLKSDYTKIKNELSSHDILQKAIEFGSGIRILKNDPYEMIVEFIISANNNIPRIKNSIEYLCRNYGKNMGDYYAFPTLEVLKKVTVEEFKKAGLGYRAEQLYETIQKLTDDSISLFKTFSSEDKIKWLLSLKGVGPKVCNCIMLFGCHEMDSFPVDTWIKKVYNDINKTNIGDAKIIEKNLKSEFKELSGYAQQYFFYYYRENFKG